MSSASDSRPATPLLEAGHDPGDPNQPLYQDHDTPSAPIGNPTADMDDDLSDSDILSDVDEAQFEDFDPANVAIDDRPAIAVDEDNVKLLGRHKRKRDGEGEVEGGKKKKKEGKRDKPKKLRKKRDEDDNFSGGEELEGKRVRKKKAEGGEGVRKEKVRPRKATPEDEEQLDPEEREWPSIRSLVGTKGLTRGFSMIGRRRALDRAMDAALKNPNKRRRRADGVVRFPFLVSVIRYLY